MNAMLRQLPDGRRVFKDATIQSAIDRATSSLETGDRFASVIHGAYLPDGTKTISASLVVRLPAGFSVAAAAYKDFTTGDKGAEGQILWKG